MTDIFEYARLQREKACGKRNSTNYENMKQIWFSLFILRDFSLPKLTVENTVR